MILIIWFIIRSQGYITTINRYDACYYIGCSGSSSSNLQQNPYLYYVYQSQYTITYWMKISSQENQYIMSLYYNFLEIFYLTCENQLFIVNYMQDSIIQTQSQNVPQMDKWINYQININIHPDFNSLDLDIKYVFNIEQGYQALFISFQIFDYTNQGSFMYSGQINFFQHPTYGGLKDRVYNLKIAYGQNNDIFNYLDHLPQIQLLHLTFEEKIETQYLTDWTMNFYPMLGTTYQQDINDPKIIGDGLQFSDQQVVSINDVNLPTSFTIILSVYIYDSFKSFQLFKIEENKYLQQVSLEVQNQVIYWKISGKEFKLLNCFAQDLNYLSIYIRFYQHPYDIYAYTEFGCYLQDIIIDQGKYSIPGIKFDTLWNIQLGSTSNTYGLWFIYKRFSLTQGVEGFGAQNYLYLCQVDLNGKCLICQTNTYNNLLYGQCQQSCTLYNGMYLPDDNIQMCRRICHPTCSTCSDPSICLSCDGIRINPPSCDCPQGYFDDKINPNCQYYFTISGIQQGKYDYLCMANTQQVRVDFPKRYDKIPKVVINIDGLNQSAFGGYYAQIQDVQVDYFIIEFYCQFQTLFSISWFSEKGNSIANSFQYQYKQDYSFQQINYAAPPSVGLINVVSITGMTIDYLSYYQGGSSYAYNEQISIYLYSQARSVNFQLVQYSQLYATGYSFYNYQPNYFGTKQQTNSYYSNNFPTNPKFIFISTYQIANQQNLIFKLIIDLDINMISSRLFIDGQNNYFSQSSTLITGLITCNNQTSYCDIQDYLIYNCFTSLGQYLDISKQCQKCSQNCTTCFQDYNLCTSCRGNYKLLDSICICPSNFYIDPYQECYQCDTLCQTCTGGDYNQCTACLYGLQLNNGQCICGEYQYFDYGYYNCQQCHYSCQQCYNQYYCSVCPADRYQSYNTYYGTYLCDCNSGFELNQICQICDSGCATCSTSTSYCTSCLDLNSQLNTGLCQCNPGYYQDAQFQCQQCSQMCTICDQTSTNCQSCVGTVQILGNQCACQLGQYFDIQSLSCLICDPNCESCVDQPNNCLTCFPFMILDQQSVCQCISGYFLETSTCSICSSECQECVTTSTYCTACNTDKYLSNNTCLCFDGYFNNNNICTACNGVCATCDNATQCLTCGANKILQNFLCVCNDGYWMDGINCAKCHYSCQLCLDGISCSTCQQYSSISNNLLCQCNLGYFEDITLQCQQCHQTCQSCVTTYSNCQTCFPNSFRFLSNNNCQCQDGYYSDSSFICQICQANCLTCNGPLISNCVSCVQTKLILNGNCNCKDGYYLDQSYICQLCDLQCLTCNQFTNCLSCIVEKVLINGQCVCQTNKYFDSNSLCQDCHFSCLTCGGPSISDCLSCLPDRNLNANNNCICADGYFIDGNLCTKCHISCQTCQNLISCLTCPTNSIIQKNTLCQCQDGFFQNQNKCSQCSQNCLTCSSLQICLSCNSSNYRQLKANICVCLDNYYENSQKQCISCKDKSAIFIQSCNYQNCNDGIWTQAEQCDDGNQIPRDGCTNCLIDSGFKCQNIILAPSFCYKCSSQCIECKQANRIVKCIQCEDGYFLSQNKCFKCGDNCLTCIQMNFCLTCYIKEKVPTELGVCPTCEQTPGTYTMNGSCVTKCGDGIITVDEDCDDGNTNDGDGCSSFCKIEEGFICSGGQCRRKPLPEISVSYINTTTTNVVKIFADESILNFCSRITSKIDDFAPTEYKFNVLKDSFSQCECQFSFNKTILETNLIHIFVPISNSNSSDIRNLGSGDVRELIIQPRRQIVYSESQLNQAQTVSNAQDTMTLFLYFIGPAAIILGGFQFFWTLLDILTWLNNLYYINVYFPANVSLIFQQSAWASISLIPTIIQFNQPTDEYYRESPPRYMDKGVDPFFFNNSYQVAGIWSAAFFFYFISIMILKIMNTEQKQIMKVNSFSKIFQITNKEDLITQPERLIVNHNNQPKFIKKILTFLTHYNQNLQSYLIKILNLTLLDLVGAIILQLMFYDISQMKNLLVLVNFICAFVCIAVVFYTLYLSYNVSVQHKTLSMHKKQKLRYGTLYESINVESESGMMYSFINLLRKTLFIGFQIYFYYRPLFQTAACCAVSFLNVAFIVYSDPFETKKDLIQILVPDTCIFLLMFICTILAIDDKVAVLSPDQRFMVGWVILGFIGLSILTQIVFLVMQFVENSINNIKAFMKYLTKKEN